MATANGSAVGVTPMESTRRNGAPLNALADLLGDVKAWARHQRMDDLVQAMTEAQALAGRIGAEVHHG